VCRGLTSLSQMGRSCTSTSPPHSRTSSRTESLVTPAPHSKGPPHQGCHYSCHCHCLCHCYFDCQYGSHCSHHSVSAWCARSLPPSGWHNSFPQREATRGVPAVHPHQCAPGRMRPSRGGVTGSRVGSRAPGHPCAAGRTHSWPRIPQPVRPPPPPPHRPLPPRGQGMPLVRP